MVIDFVVVVVMDFLDGCLRHLARFAKEEPPNASRADSRFRGLARGERVVLVVAGRPASFASSTDVFHCRRVLRIGWQINQGAV